MCKISRPSMYSFLCPPQKVCQGVQWDLKTNLLNTGNIRIPNFFEVQILYAWILDQYIRKQDGIHLSCIKMVGLSAIEVAFKILTTWCPISFGPLKYQTSLVFRYPLHVILHLISPKLKILRLLWSVYRNAF